MTFKKIYNNYKKAINKRESQHYWFMATNIHIYHLQPQNSTNLSSSIRITFSRISHIIDHKLDYNFFEGLELYAVFYNNEIK